jgi:lysophospholipase L1-like esterase
MIGRLTTLIALALLAAAPVAAAAAEPTPEQRAQWAKEAEQRLHEDWAYLGRYREANAQLPARGEQPRVIFLGDSITQGWYDKAPNFFTPGRIGRGIGGQTTPQMLVRFRQDVINLHPDVVQIMAATNDVAGNTGPTSDAAIEDNFRSMVELAHANGIRVILASIPPTADFPWRTGLNPGSRIVALNGWLKAYAAETGSVYADYWTALSDGGLGIRPELTYDGVHPNEAGYAAMAPVADAAIAAALKLPKP